MTPCQGEYCSNCFFSATLSSWSLTLEGFFELTLRPSRVVDLALCVAFGTSEIRGHSQVCWARPGASRTPSKNNWCNPWLFVCGQPTFWHWSLIVNFQQNTIESMSRPGHSHWTWVQSLSSHGENLRGQSPHGWGRQACHQLWVSKAPEISPNVYYSVYCLKLFQLHFVFISNEGQHSYSGQKWKYCWQVGGVYFFNIILAWPVAQFQKMGANCKCKWSLKNNFCHTFFLKMLPRH